MMNMNKLKKSKGLATLCLATMMLGAAFTVNAADSAQQLTVVEQTKDVQIAPHGISSFYDENGKVNDGIFCADIRPATIKDVDGGITVDATLYIESEYNAGAIHEMKPGDTVLYNDKVITVETVEGNDPVILVNGGYENDGISFFPNEGGTYMTREDNDYCSFTKIAEGTLFIDENTVLTDKRDISNQDGTTYTGAEQIKAFMEKEPTEFSTMKCLNTRVEFSNGNLANINLFYTP